MKREVKRKKTKRQKQNNVIIVVVVVMIIARQIVERKFETTKARMVQTGVDGGGSRSLAKVYKLTPLSLF